MSLGCAVGCGRCCDPVELGPGTWEALTFWAPEGPWSRLPDPAEDWEAWAACGWRDDLRDENIARWNNPDDPIRVNAAFAAEHWTARPTTAGKLLMARLTGLTDITRIDCDAFDHDHRVCTAHTDRPPICSGFPWYDFDPVSSVRDGVRPPPYPRANGTVGGGSVACSYLRDLPPDLRSPTARPLLPITPV